MIKTHDQPFAYTSVGGRLSHCHIKVYQAREELPLVIATECDDNPGSSVTDSIEALVNAVWRELLPRAEGLRLVEHHAAHELILGPWDRESFDLVTFDEEEPYRLASPTWRPLSPEAVAAMIGERAADRPGRVYVGERDLDDEFDERVYVEGGGQRRPLHHVVYHSPNGLEFGYGGSGPADTALSILADYLGEQPTAAQLERGEARCWRLHHRFKQAFIAPAPYEGFRQPATAIVAWLEQHEGAEDDVGGP